MFVVLCTDDSKRPNEVPLSQWIKAGERYSVIREVNCLGQGIKGYELEEVKIDSALYKYFAASRFVPISEPPVEKLEEVLEEVF